MGAKVFQLRVQRLDTLILERMSESDRVLSQIRTKILKYVT